MFKIAHRCSFFVVFFLKHNLPEVKACKSVDLQAWVRADVFRGEHETPVYFGFGFFSLQLHGNKMFAEKTHTYIYVWKKRRRAKTHSRSRAKEPCALWCSNCVPDIWSMHFTPLSDRAEQSAMGPDSIGFISTLRFCWTRSRPPTGMCKAWKYHVEEHAIS